MKTTIHIYTNHNTLSFSIEKENVESIESNDWIRLKFKKEILVFLYDEDNVLSLIRSTELIISSQTIERITKYDGYTFQYYTINEFINFYI